MSGDTISRKSPSGSPRVINGAPPNSRGARLAKVNKGELAELLGYTERTLTDWQSEGLPIEHAGARGQENVYDTAAVVAWLLERAARKAGGESARDEYLRSQTRLNEIKIAEQEGRLVEIAVLEPLLIRMIVGVRIRLLQIPAMIVDSLQGLNRAAQREMLEKEILAALVELSAYDVTRGASSK